MRSIQEGNIISNEDRELLGEVKAIVQRFIPAADLLLYGSGARGARTPEPESDYDLLVLTDYPVGIEEQNKIRDAMYDYELSQGILICLVFYDRNEWNSPPDSGSPFHYNVEREAVVL